MLKKIEKVFDGAVEIVGAVFLCFVVFGTITNVILRYCFGYTIPWIEEAVVYSFVWLCYVGAAGCFKANSLTVIDVLYNVFPRPVRRVLDVVGNLICLATALLVTKLSMTMIANVGTKSTYVLRLSYRYIDGAILFCFAIMSIVGIYKTVKSVIALFRPGPDETPITTE